MDVLSDGGGTSSDPHYCFFFTFFFLTKLKFLYKFHLVFSFKGLGFRQQITEG